MPRQHARNETRSAPVSSHASARDARQRLRLVRNEPSTPDALDDALLAFDVDDDVAAIIPMPASIPAPIRAAITRAIGARFEFADELDAWLHAPSEALAGATPFERVVAGDGAAVLAALHGTRESAGARPGPVSTAPDVQATRRVVG